MPFIHIFSWRKQKEIIVNTDHISRIEVEYVIEGPDPKNSTKICHFPISLEKGLKNPNAIRMYHIFIGEEEFRLSANLNDPIIKVIENIYKDAVKG